MSLVRSTVNAFVGCGLAAMLAVNSQAMVPQETNADIRVPATVHGYQTTEVYAKVGGYLETINFDIGDKVDDGEVVAILDIPEMKLKLLQKESMVKQAEAEMAQAQAGVEESEAKLASLAAGVEEALTDVKQKNAMLRYAQKEQERMMNLVGSGSVNRELLDSATFKLESAKAEIESAEARVTTARANLTAQDASIRRAEADKASAESKVKVAEADRDYVTELMNYSTIRAPFTGYVTKRYFDEGAYVQPAEGNSAAKPLFEIISMEKVRVVVNLSMSQISKVKVGDKATLGKMDALPDEQFEGTISRFSAGIDSQTRMMRVEVDLENPDAKLKSGYFGYLTIKPSGK